MRGLKCSFVNAISPGDYLVLSQDENHISEIKHLEKCLRKEVKYQGVPDSKHFILQQNVVVEYPEGKGLFKRGRLEHGVNENNYAVFLVDYGKMITVKRDQIFINLNENLNAIEPLTFRLKLHGLLPVTACLVGGIPRQRVCELWSAESQTFVRELFESTQVVMVESILIYGNVVYGDLLIVRKDSVTSLRKSLIERRYCVYSEKNFLRKIFSVRHAEKFSMVGVAEQKDIEPAERIGTETTGKSGESTGDDATASNATKFAEDRAPGNKFLMETCRSRSVADNEFSSFGCSPFSGDRGKSQWRRVYIGRGINVNFLEPTPRENLSRSVHGWKTSLVADADSLDETELDDILLTENPLLRSEVERVEAVGSAVISPEPLDASIFSGANIGHSSWSRGRQYGDPFVWFNESEPVEPVYRFTDLMIDADLKQTLNERRRFEDLSSLQRWVVPSILGGRNVVVIGSTKTGKTMSYIVPVIDLLKKACQSKLPEGNGPLTVVVCSTSAACEFIYKTCSSLLKKGIDESSKNGQISVVVAHGGGREEQSWVNLTNGCHLLISTPPCLARLLKMAIVTNLERLRSLVLDEIDVISREPFKSDVKYSLGIVGSIAKNCQKIICGTMWTPEVENLTKSQVGRYTLVMSSYQDVAVFVRLKPIVYFVDRNQKLDVLLGEIFKSLGKGKILICCESASEALDVHSFLDSKSVNSLVAHERLTADRCKDVVSDWNPFKPLVATDGILKELNIKKADFLIHHTITRTSKTNFFFRYSTILGCCTDGGSDPKDPREKTTPSDLIIIDDDNCNQAPQIIDFVTRLGGSVPSRLREITDEIVRNREISKDSAFCENLLNLGRCRNRNACSQRHAFVSSVDSAAGLPSAGWVAFSVVRVHSANRFAARLLYHVSEDGEFFCKSIPGSRLEVAHERLQQHYGSNSDRRIIEQPKVGTICALRRNRLAADVFHRVEIVDLTQRDTFGKPTMARVRLIDEGDFAEAEVINLYALPFELASRPPSTFDVILAGIQPVDFDLYWSKEATAFTNKLLMRKLENNETWFGKIEFALGNILFLGPVMLKRFLAGVKANIFDLAVREEILKSGLAVKNEEHLRLLKSLLCERGPVETRPGEDVPESSASPQPEWATFREKRVPVILSAFKDAPTIFLRSKVLENSLAKLEEDCQKEAEESAVRNPSPGTTLLPGDFCLVEHENRWKRGRVESVEESMFAVFSVDYGFVFSVAKEKVIPISKASLLRLPCQAVECSLVGVESGEESVSKYLQDLNDLASNGLCIYADIWREDLKATKTGGLKYGVTLSNEVGHPMNNVETDGNLPDIKNIGTGEEKEDDANAGADADLEAYLSRIPETLFANKSEIRFLLEVEHRSQKANVTFASRLSAPPQTPVVSVSSRTVRGKKSKLNYSRLLSLHRSAKTNVKREGAKLATPRVDLLMPQVRWRQTHSTVHLKVEVNNAGRYKCHCTTSNILLRCVVEDKSYVVDLKLFGGIRPDEMAVAVKTFQVDISLKKALPMLWPRFLRDEGRHCHIRSDPEAVRRREDSLSETIRMVEANVRAGLVKPGLRTGNLQPYSDSESSREDEEEFRCSENEE